MLRSRPSPRAYRQAAHGAAALAVLSRLTLDRAAHGLEPLSLASVLAIHLALRHGGRLTRHCYWTDCPVIETPGGLEESVAAALRSAGFDPYRWKGTAVPTPATTTAYYLFSVKEMGAR
jgi:hypothetical protein